MPSSGILQLHSNITRSGKSYIHELSVPTILCDIICVFTIGYTREKQRVCPDHVGSERRPFVGGFQSASLGTFERRPEHASNTRGRIAETERSTGATEDEDKHEADGR